LRKIGKTPCQLTEAGRRATAIAAIKTNASIVVKRREIAADIGGVPLCEVNIRLWITLYTLSPRWWLSVKSR
jgi:hypothetical protein